MWINFVLPRTFQSQVFQLVLRQPLTQVVRLFLAVQLPDFNLASAFSSAVSFTVALTSHIIFRSTFSSFWIQFRSCRLTVLFYFLFSEIQLFLYGIQINACSEVSYWILRSFFQKKIKFVFEKKKPVIPFPVWFRNHNGRFSNQFLLQTIYQGQISSCRPKSDGHWST